MRLAESAASARACAAWGVGTSRTPRNPVQGAAAIEAHKTFADLVIAGIPEPARDKPIELCWQDDARVGQRAH